MVYRVNQFQYQQKTEPVFFVELLTEDKWHQGWSVPPVLTKPGLLAAEQQFLAFAIGPPLVSFSYFEELSRPSVLAKVFLPPSEQTFIALEPAPSPFVATGWFNWLTEPVRQKPGLHAELQQFLAAPSRLLPPPNIRGVLNAQEKKDTFLGGARAWNRVISGEVGIIEGTLALAAGETAVTQTPITSAHISIRIL